MRLHLTWSADYEVFIPAGTLIVTESAGGSRLIVQNA